MVLFLGFLDVEQVDGLVEHSGRLQVGAGVGGVVVGHDGRVVVFDSDARLAVDGTWLDRLTLDPAWYSHLIVICGPLTPAMAVQHESIFGRFQHCVHIGVNLTMVAPTATFNPFEVLLERDSDRITRADLSFRENPPRVPVIGLCLTGFQ